MDSVDNNITGANINHSHRNRQDKNGFVDIHCHCLPGIDDGPASVQDALALSMKMAEDGITTAIATPHQLGRFDGSNSAKNVRDAVINYNKVLEQNGIAMTILPGGEVRVDERVCRLLEKDEILTLADSGKYILLELPNDIFINIDSLIRDLSSMGVQSVIAHAERIPHLSHRTEILRSWLEHGGLLQVTASSIIGDFGLEFQRNAWQLLCSSCVSFIATDCHDTNSRSPKMIAAFQFIRDNSQPDTAHRLCLDNPSRVIDNRHIENRTANYESLITKNQEVD